VLYSHQPKRLIHLTIDDHEDSPVGWSSNSIGGVNTQPGVTAVEEELRYRAKPSRNYYAHDTRGQRVTWSPPKTISAGAAGLTQPAKAGIVALGLNRLNAARFEYLSLRVGQRYRAQGNKNPANQPQSLSVRLVDTDGHASPLIFVDTYVPIHTTSAASLPKWIKSIMQTVRIPLRAFTANGSRLDLGKLSRVELVFNRVPLGELIIDDVELLGLDVSRPERSGER
jgi:hypothetical protein